MKKKIMLIIFLFAFVIGLVLINNYLNNREISNESKNEIEKVETKEVSKIVTVTTNTFEKEVLNSDKPVLIDFYANWCPPCKKLSPLVEEVANKNDEVKFVKINVDNEEELANKYGISSIPTLVLTKNGEEVDRSIGLISKAQIEALVKQ